MRENFNFHPCDIGLLFLVTCLVFQQVSNANESEDASTSSKKPVIKETLSLSTVDGKMADSSDTGSPRSVSKPLTIEVKSSKERKRTNSKLFNPWNFPLSLIQLSQNSPFNSKTCLKHLLKRRPKIGFQGRSSFSAGQKYYRMLQSFCNTLALH